MDDEWWTNAFEEDSFESLLTFDDSENGLWNGRFVPPPPKPPFLNETITFDNNSNSVCEWPWHESNFYSFNGSFEAVSESGWAFTLIVILIIFSVIGAIVMVEVLRKKSILNRMFPRLLVPSMETITTTVATATNTNSSSSANAAARVPPTDDSISFLSDDEWWINAIEEDSFDDNEFNLWNRSFVPPPPRPPFLNESVTSDGLSTCDLCTWALHERNLHTLEGSLEAAGELGWAFTLIIVSVISALIGAIVMVIVLRCRRLKSGNNNGGRPVSLWCRNNETSRNVTTKHTADRIRRPTSNSGVWTWLNIQQPSSGPDLIDVQSPLPAENRYSQINDPYNPVGVDEALYAELDTESVQSNNPPFKTSHIENVVRITIRIL